MQNVEFTDIINVAIDDFRGSTLPINYIDTDIVLIDRFADLPYVANVKLQLNLLVSCFAGRASFEVAGTTYVLQEGQTLVCPSGTLLANAMATPDIQITMIGLTDRIINSVLVNNVDIWNKAVYGDTIHIGNRPTKSREVSKNFGNLLNMIIQWKDHPFREQMVRSLLQLIILSVCAYFKMSDKNPETNSDQKSPQGRVLFNRYMEMLKVEEVKHRPVYYYAEKLCISAKYLSHICKEISGKSANEFIQAAVMTDIEYYLRNTTMSVKEISAKMGFPNISFFGKYVKGHVGLSPNEYRKKIFAEK